LGHQRTHTSLFPLCPVQGALQRILLQSDVAAAVSFVEGEIMRLLTGNVGVWELAMTGGLWRVTGQQLEKAAAAGEPAGDT
jgi:DNA polymerase delta subunit 1